MTAAPSDPALPQLNQLLDTEAMAPVLARSLGNESAVEELRVERVLYKPRRRIAVHFQALVDGERHDAVARATAKGAAALELPRYLDAAREINGRSPASIPVAYDGELDALVTWLPFDAALPALAQPPERLLERLPRIGVVRAEAHLLGYKPGARAVMRLGDHVLKSYGKDAQHRRAAAGLAASSASASVRTATYVASFPDLRLTVQSAVDGAVPRAAVDVAAEAGAVARRLQRERLALPLGEATPPSLVAAAERRAALISVIVPELADRLDALVGRLREAMPSGIPLVPTHGDFHVDQLLRVGTDLVLIDFDDMCLAPPALDLASYLADVVRGRESDLAQIETVRAPLLRGYGGCPPALEWHLAAVTLSRATHPFQRFVPGWPERIEKMVAAAEAVLARCEGTP
jgi:hypothetical protein